MRITTRGYGLLTAGTLLLVAGFRFGYAELAALGCAAVVAVAVALAFVSWRPRLTVGRVVNPDRVMRGESSNVSLSIANASRLFGASLVARDRVTPRSANPAAPATAGSATGGSATAGSIVAGSIAVPIVQLRPEKRTTLTYAAPTNKRGLVTVGPLEISRRDPLGLVGVVRRYGETDTVWVHPRIHPITAVPVGLSRSMDGRVDRVPHGSITFAALRQYVIGDDLRHVHWRTSARVGDLMVREHVDTSLPCMVILLDDRADAHGTTADGESTFEGACEAAASILVAAIRDGLHAELRLLSGAAASSAGRETGPVLDLLAEATLTPGQAGSAELHNAVEQLRLRRLGDTLLYLTGPPTEDDLGLVAGLRGAYPSIIAGVFGAVEPGLTTSAGILVVGAADGADFAGAWDGIRAW